MTNRIKIRLGRKADSPAERVGQAERAGPQAEVEVSGQSQARLLECPWCAGVNRVGEAGGCEAWSCAWCGNVFY